MRRWGCAAAIALAVGCGGGAPPSVGSQLAPALVAALEAADHTRAPWRCAAEDGPALVSERLELGDHTWTLRDHVVELAGSGAIEIGVIADAGGAAPETLAAIGALRERLGHADLVIALGGMGATQAELEATLGALSDRASWPVIAVPGDLEPAGAHAAAIDALRGRGGHVIDGRRVRRIELPGATIAPIPGAGSEHRLVAGVEGCAYRPEDLARAFQELTARPGLRIVASTEAPRIVVEGEPAGELALSPGATHEIDISLHGPTTEAPTPSRTGERDGAAVALSPGSSDATTRLPGPRHAPSAGILTLHGNAWRWKPIRGIGD